MALKEGSFRLFRFAGIDVFLHWSWLLVAYFQIAMRGREYESPVWKAIEYVSLFGIVLMHEFGHALACRSVGGVADHIVLWPFGGIAFVNPPPRPGALLWSIAAGPLVNVMLVPVLFGMSLLVQASGHPDLARYCFIIQLINGVLLVFNILPIYPLDGGQMLQALLWFVIGRSRSLYVSSVLGIIGAIALAAFAFFSGILSPVWTGLIALFLISQCVRGFKMARLVADISGMPRHGGYACPGCGSPPLRGAFWKCGNCGRQFDTFETGGRCPGCGATYETTSCLECRRQYPMSAWGRT